jgi:hypothetical protein
LHCKTAGYRRRWERHQEFATEASLIRAEEDECGDHSLGGGTVERSLSNGFIESFWQCRSAPAVTSRTGDAKTLRQIWLKWSQIYKYDV